MKIYAVSGYSEIGRNMTCIESNDEAVILDMGLNLEEYIRLTGDDEYRVFSARQLIKSRAIPDDTSIKKLKKNILAIIPSHGHLDHIGAIPFLSSKYSCPIIATPYTASVIKAIIKDKNQTLTNNVISLKLNKKIKLSENFTIEFISMTHSIPETALILVHTKEGNIAYCCDFKLDNTPT
jgi:ribonuclease J